MKAANETEAPQWQPTSKLRCAGSARCRARGARRPQRKSGRSSRTCVGLQLRAAFPAVPSPLARSSRHSAPSCCRSSAPLACSSFFTSSGNLHHQELRCPLLHSAIASQPASQLLVFFFFVFLRLLVSFASAVTFSPIQLALPPPFLSVYISSLFQSLPVSSTLTHLSL